MKIFFSVGEPSGDLHGANLIRRLQHRQPDIECVGYGGPRMAAAGCRIDADLTQLAVMWFARVLARLPTFWNLLVRADRYFQHHRPDAVVLIDYPGFNWWIARRAKAHGIPVFYYGVPQLWAWAGWRVRKMRRFVDHVLCKLPFEESWYRERGCQASYVGHPYFDELETRRLDTSCLESLTRPAGPLVTILPGSRTQEVSKNLDSLIKAAHRIHARVPEARFAVAAFKSSQAEWVRKHLHATDLPISVWVGKTPELIHAATCCMAVSGSVSLELLYHAKPSVILYQISRPAYWVQGYFRKVKFITLVNLLAMQHQSDGEPLQHISRTRCRSTPGHQPVASPFSIPRAASYNPDNPEDADVPMPEYLTCIDKSEQLAEHIIEWLTNASIRQKRVAQLEALSAQIGCAGASERAADYIVNALENLPAIRVRAPARHAAA